MQNLPPDDIKIRRWHHPYLAYFWLHFTVGISGGTSSIFYTVYAAHTNLIVPSHNTNCSSTVRLTSSAPLCLFPHNDVKLSLMKTLPPESHSTLFVAVLLCCSTGGQSILIQPHRVRGLHCSDIKVTLASSSNTNVLLFVTSFCQTEAY